MGAGILDFALARLAPRAALRRLSARVAFDNLARSYDGAARGRLTDGWHTANNSADVEISAAAGILRSRSRDLVRNDAVAAKAVQVLVSNLVGTGIRPRAASGDPALDRLADDLFAQWSQDCDADGHTDFHGLTALAVREMIEGGDVFALRRRTRPRAGQLVPLEIELKEADHLDVARSSLLPAANTIKDGIEYDSRGRRLAYWLFPDHPGDSYPNISRELRSVRVSADGVSHLFERQRTQSRGVPWAAPAMRALRDVGDWQRAELVRKRTEACLAAVVVANDDDQQGVTAAIEDQSTGKLIESFEPGMIARARGAKAIEFNQPTSTAGIYEWHRVQLHIVSAGMRVPYELLTGDLSQVNFSSSRVGLNEFRRMVRMVQAATIIPMFCRPVWRWFCEAAWLAGRLPAPDIPVKWTPPAFESVNPLQDAQADQLEVRSGFMPLRDAIARRGRDPGDVMRDHIEDFDALDAAGLVFDTDPRRVAKAGTAQTVAPGDQQGGSAPQAEES